MSVAGPCRFCDTTLSVTFVDLGMSPPCQTQIPFEKAASAEVFYPLHAMVCTSCFLVQIDEVLAPVELFGDGQYPYHSSFSQSWLDHAKRYAVEMTALLGLSPASRVFEIASNDGYLLQYFHAAGIPAVGIEPASNCAQVARSKGIETEVAFFGRETAQGLLEKYGPADLLLGNNVLAHVPDLNDFVAGMKVLLGADGTLTMEFPHLKNLVESNQFDTIYHEHFSYLGFETVRRIFSHHGLTIFDVTELPTHGGSLRIFARHAEHESSRAKSSVAEMAEREIAAGMNDVAWYSGFGERVEATKRELLAFLISARDRGERVAGYGAPGKGNTLLNYCGIRTDFLDYTVDRSPHKQGHFTPGTRIPIYAPDKIFETRPDYVLILPWNLADEISEQMAGIREWGGKFVVPIPTVRVF